MKMLPFEEALKIVMSSSFRTAVETVPFGNSLDRILAENIISDMDMPPFNKASVDGFACKKENLEMEMEVIETIPAGKWPEKRPGKGQCSRIMTGAPVPDGTDCVIMVEDTESLSSGKIKFKGHLVKENIARRGEDVKKGEVVIKEGTKISPQVIAVMASVGHTNVKVNKRPAVAVISSGDELVEPEETPGPSGIRNSNAYQLLAQMETAGIHGRYYGIAKDDEEETLRMAEKAISENDLVLLTGGVSMGDFDFIPAVLEKAGVKIIFGRIAVQPGKPTTFGIHKKALVFGLPGNPVSSFVIFEMLVRPLIFRMMGFLWEPEIKFLTMAEKFSRRFDDRLAFVPVSITDDNRVLPVEYHGSGHITALAGARGIITVPLGIKNIEKGEIVGVRQI